MIYQQFTYPSGNKSSEGYFLNGKPHGYWSNFYETGEQSSSGKWNENGLDSIWSFYTKNGQLLKTISFENNLKNGPYIAYDSLAQISFLGMYVNDTLQGDYEKYLDGKLIESGIYENGLQNGKIQTYDEQTGIIQTISDFTNGEKQSEKAINQIVDGRKEGVWQFFDKNGELIRQEIYENDQLQTDDPKNYVPFIIQKEYFYNGQLKATYMLQNGKKEGVQRNYDSLGGFMPAEIYEDDTLRATGWLTAQGFKDSLWMYYYRDQQLASKGNYKVGKKEGMWMYYFPNGNIEQKGKYTNDLPTGNWLWYYPNGQIRREENYYRGKYEGEVKDYDENGNLIQNRNFVYNSLEGDLYYFIGDRKEKGRMENGVREGKWVFYYGDDKKEFIGKYKDGLPQGKHKFWFGNGRRAFVMRYKRGKLHGKKLEFNESGGVNHVYIYKRGELMFIDNEKVVEKAIKR